MDREVSPPVEGEIGLHLDAKYNLRIRRQAVGDERDYPRKVLIVLSLLLRSVYDEWLSIGAQ